MSRDDPDAPLLGERLFCDLTQSWSDVGGGVRTYLLHKRGHILSSTPHRHLAIVPGPRDEVIVEGRATTVTIRSPHVPGSPHYRDQLAPWIAGGYHIVHLTRAGVEADLATTTIILPAG